MLVEIWSLNTTGAEQGLPKDMLWKGRIGKEIFWEVSLQDEMNFQNIKRLQKGKLKFQYLSWDVKNSKVFLIQLKHGQSTPMSGWP